VSHFGHANYIKMYLQAKGELWKLKYFTMQKYNSKNPLKETKILQDIITLQLISSFNTRQNIFFQKSLYKNRPIITWGQNCLSYYILLYSIMNLNKISLPWYAGPKTDLVTFGKISTPPMTPTYIVPTH